MFDLNILKKKKEQTSSFLLFFFFYVSTGRKKNSRSIERRKRADSSRRNMSIQYCILEGHAKAAEGYIIQHSQSIDCRLAARTLPLWVGKKQKKKKQFSTRWTKKINKQNMFLLISMLVSTMSLIFSAIHLSGSNPIRSTVGPR